jgi:hypothetical protein
VFFWQKIRGLARCTMFFCGAAMVFAETGLAGDLAVPVKYPVKAQPPPVAPIHYWLAADYLGWWTNTPPRLHS